MSFPSYVDNCTCVIHRKAQCQGCTAMLHCKWFMPALQNQYQKLGSKHLQGAAASQSLWVYKCKFSGVEHAQTKVLVLEMFVCMDQHYGALGA